MAKDPAFLFYPGDFMMGTTLFTYDQRGKYATLLCCQHQIGHLSKSDMVLVCGSEDEKIFSKFEIDADGLYFNKRLEEEKFKRSNFTQSRLNNLHSHKEDHMAVHMGEGSDEKKTKKTKKATPAPRVFIPPTLEQITVYCTERGNNINPQHFFDRNTATGWVDKNGNKYKDWKAVVRTWENFKEAIKAPVAAPAGKRPVMIVVVEKIAAGKDNHAIMQELVGTYTEHAINEAIGQARGKVQ